jgi:hypothetical protein
MSALRRFSLPSNGSTPTNPLDLWGRRVTVGVTVLIGLPVLIAGMLSPLF